MKAIDLFAGLGGNTVGAKLAGCDVIWAANHNPVAVDFHERNNPGADHSCQDLQQADWSTVPGHDLLLASPCCQGHTKARGKEGVHHHKSRSTAWAVISCAEYHLPGAIMVENVQEFLNWQLFPVWRSALEALGYTLSINVLDAADHGIAQNRERAYIIGTRSKAPFELKKAERHHVNARNVIDFNEGKWNSILNPVGRTRSKKTIAQIEQGRKELKTDQFLIPYYGSGSGMTGRSLDRPIGTVTTRDRWAVINGDKMRMCTVDEYRQFMSFPEGTELPDHRGKAIQLLGNATCPTKIGDIVSQLRAAA